MAAISPEALIAATPTTFARQETNAHFFKRVSHLNLQERRLTSLAGIEVCANLRFLFAFGNRLRAIPEAVLELPALEILTLDRNEIDELRNLDSSRRLRKLHLSQNRISRVEGLEACDSLEELHVARQRRGDGAPPLSFASSSIRALARSLRWLDVTGCGLLSLGALAPCERVRAAAAAPPAAPADRVRSLSVQLTRLDAADNALCDLSELLSLMHGSWLCLETVGGCCLLPAGAGLATPCTPPPSRVARSAREPCSARAGSERRHAQRSRCRSRQRCRAALGPHRRGGCVVARAPSWSCTPCMPLRIPRRLRLALRA